MTSKFSAAAVALLLLIFTAPAVAATWVPIPGYAAQVDMASVRKDSFPKPGPGGIITFGPGGTETYSVA
jgi:hypothetical protein